MFSQFLTAILLGRVLGRLRFLPLQFREQKKSQGARSVEYGDCGDIIVSFLFKNSRTSNDVRAGALSWCKIQNSRYFLNRPRIFALLHSLVGHTPVWEVISTGFSRLCLNSIHLHIHKSSLDYQIQIDFTMDGFTICLISSAISESPATNLCVCFTFKSTRFRVLVVWSFESPCVSRYSALV